MHESGWCMIIGVILSLFANFLNPSTNFTNSFNFKDDIFFTFILPPIIFSAGYNLRRVAFFKYFMYISAFGVLGTIMSFLFVAPCTYWFDKYDFFYFTHHYHSSVMSNHTNITNPILPDGNSSWFALNDIILNNKSNDNIDDTNNTYLNTQEEINGTWEGTNSSDGLVPHQTKEENEVINFTFAEILLFASVISATDTIAALTFIKEESEPKLFSIWFGEGVWNDAVCIVWYRIWRGYTSTGKEFTSKTPVIMWNEFINLFLFSFIVGAFVGCWCAYLLKYFKTHDIKWNRPQEIAVLLFFAFISYTLAEEMSLSPIISLLFAGMFMSNYAFYNLSFQAREESAVVSRIMSNISEAFVFTYLGLTLTYYMTHSLSLSFIFIELFVVVFGRIFAIFGLCFILKFFDIKNFKMKTSQKGIMSCAGSIRGAISFGLAISIDTNNKSNKEVWISSTLILVFITTILFGALMPFLISLMKKLDPPENIENQPLLQPTQFEEASSCEKFNFLHPNFEVVTEISKEKDIEVLKNRLSYWLGHYWFEFDEVYIKPRWCYKWPWAREDNMNLKTVIINAINKYEEEHKNIDHNYKPTNRLSSILLSKQENTSQKYIELDTMQKSESK